MSDTNYGVMNSEDLPQPCTCSACQQVGARGLENDGPVVSDDPLDMPTVTASPEQFANYLTSGFWSDIGSRSRQWNTDSDNEITFSINNNYTADQKVGIRMAFDMWADVADITFREISSNADIDMITNSSNRAFSSSSVFSGSGDIASNYISMDNSQWYWTNFDELGDYAMLTALHEIGHSLGLGHTANYNGSGTYANDAQFVNDSHQYSVMSYFNASNTGSNHGGEYASTAMLYDILAIQSIYGANTTTRSGDTTYGFNDNTGLDQFDFTVNVRPVVSIWDTGGTDTIDVSGFSQNQIIRLEAGEFSNVGGLSGNVSVAIGSVIENAIGGTGNDWLFGNDVVNNLDAGIGNDRVYGSLGSDTLNGGNGNDTLYYEDDDLSDFTITAINPTTLQFTHNTLGYTDTASNFELYNIGGTTYAHSFLNSLLNVNYIELAIGGENGAWRYEVGNAVAGDISIDSGDIGLGGSTVYTSGNRANNTTLTMADEGNNTESLSIGTGVVRNFTASNFEWIEGYLTSSSGVSASITGVQRGRLITDSGNDSITVTSALADGSDSLIFGINSGAGNDTIAYTSGHTSLVVSIDGGIGNDNITITGSSRSEILGGDGDDVIRGGTDFDLVRGGFGNDEIRGGNDNDRLYGDEGDDEIWGDSGVDLLYGGDGMDTMYGGTGNDRLYGDAGDDTLFGSGGNDRIYGGAGADIINGGGQDDLIYGEGEDDTINGGDGNDTVNGGGGNDTINGGNGNDRIFAKEDNDTVTGGSGNDEIRGGNGDDDISGDTGADRLYGDSGDDTIDGGSDNDQIWGGNGDDIIDGGAGSDTINAGNNNDTVDGGDGNDIINGDAGNDVLNGDGGNDTISGGTGNDTINGGEGNDNLQGAVGDDTVNGGNGDDTLNGFTGDDILNGGDGVDRLYGQDDNDTLFGGAGNDLLEGGNGNDILNGGDGRDTIRGGNGNDTLIGSGQRDFLFGDAGADVFATVEFNGQNDRYYTFDLDTGDTINVTDILALGSYNHGVSDINDFITFVDLGSATAMYVDTSGGGATNDLVAAIYTNDLDGFNASTLMAQNDLIANQSVL